MFNDEIEDLTDYAAEEFCSVEVAARHKQLRILLNDLGRELEPEALAQMLAARGCVASAADVARDIAAMKAQAAQNKLTERG